MQYFDDIAKRRHELLNNTALSNTFQGRVISIEQDADGVYTKLATPLGALKVPPSSGDTLGRIRGRFNTQLGVADIPF